MSSPPPSTWSISCVDIAFAARAAYVLPCLYSALLHTRSTAGADLLHQYVDSNAVFRLVTDLRFEDPRVPSPRLMIVKVGRGEQTNCPLQTAWSLCEVVELVFVARALRSCRSQLFAGR